MVCGLEIIIPILGAITAVATLGTALSEGLPFIKKWSGNGILHSIYHLIKKPDECVILKEN